VLSPDDSGKARVAAILRQLLARYDDVVYRAAPGTATVVELTRKTEARVVAILRHLLAGYEDVRLPGPPRAP
jgi:hypothetical protein